MGLTVHILLYLFKHLKKGHHPLHSNFILAFSKSDFTDMGVFGKHIVGFPATHNYASSLAVLYINGT